MKMTHAMLLVESRQEKEPIRDRFTDSKAVAFLHRPLCPGQPVVDGDDHGELHLRDLQHPGRHCDDHGGAQHDRLCSERSSHHPDHASRYKKMSD